MRNLCLLILSLACFLSAKSQNRPTPPLYWSVYENHILKPDNLENYISEEDFQANIDWVETTLLPHGYNMICIDGWGDDSNYNEHGYRSTHSSHWEHDYAWWSEYLQGKGMKLGMYNNPLWVIQSAADQGLKIKGTDIPLASIIDPSENALWFKWVQVDQPGAEEYVKGYVQFYADMGIDYLRVDFLSWFEDGFDKNLGTVGVNRPRSEYETALKWMSEACEANGMFLSLVMPHLKEEGILEREYGHMFRINEDVGEGTWYRFSDMDRGTRYSWWSQYYNTFDGLTYWSQYSNEVVLDGDFIRLNTMANDDEKQAVMSLHYLSGGAISVADQSHTIGDDAHFYQNDVLLDWHQKGHYAQPLSFDPTEDESQIWVGYDDNDDLMVGLFNREGATLQRCINFRDIGLVGDFSGINLWNETTTSTTNSYCQDVAAHGAEVWRFYVNHQPNMYLAGSFNDWSLSNELTLENGVWSTEITLTVGNHELKFANTNDWTGEDWGNNTGSNGKAKLSTGGAPNIAFTADHSGTYEVLFNDKTMAYEINYVPVVGIDELHAIASDSDTKLFYHELGADFQSGVTSVFDLTGKMVSASSMLPAGYYIIK